MELQTITYLVVGATFALYIGIAIWARAGSTKEFYVAGGGVQHRGLPARVSLNRLRGLLQ
jgi:Na+(H+)/acetate symporter ActP